MKFVHDIQPLGTHKARIQRSSDDSITLCPCCNKHLETQVHLLLCSQNPARAKAMTTLQNVCRKSDGTRFSQVIGDLLIQWLTWPTRTPDLLHRINPFLRHEHFPQQYLEIIYAAIAEQTKIGWINLFRGFLSMKWHRMASSHFDYDDESTIIQRNDGANRVHRILNHIHTYTSDIWKGAKQSPPRSRQRTGTKTPICTRYRNHQVSYGGRSRFIRRQVLLRNVLKPTTKRKYCQ